MDETQTATAQVGRNRSFTTREVPWARVGTVIEHDVDAAEAARLGGMDFNVRLDEAGHRRPGTVSDVAPLGVADQVELDALRAEVEAAVAGRTTGRDTYDALRKFGRHVPGLLARLRELESARSTHADATDDDGWAVDPDRLAVVTDDDREEVFDFVSRSYRVVQWADALNFLDSVNPRYVAAGTFSRRRQGFLVVQSPRAAHLDVDLGGGVTDPHDLYIILQTSHNRSRGIQVSLLPLRGVCMNQLPLRTFAVGAQQRWSIHHIGDPMAKLHEAAETLNRLDAYAEVYARTARQLAETDVLLADARTILDQTLRTHLHSDEIRGRHVNAIVDAWQHSNRVGFAGTGWGLVNATGEHLEWGRDLGSRTDQSRWLSGLEGPTAQAVNRVAQLVQARRSR